MIKFFIAILLSLNLMGKAYAKQDTVYFLINPHNCKSFAPDYNKIIKTLSSKNYFIIHLLCCIREKEKNIFFTNNLNVSPENKVIKVDDALYNKLIDHQNKDHQLVFLKNGNILKQELISKYLSSINIREQSRLKDSILINESDLIISPNSAFSIIDEKNIFLLDPVYNNAILYNTENSQYKYISKKLNDNYVKTIYRILYPDDLKFNQAIRCRNEYLQKDSLLQEIHYGTYSIDSKKISIIAKLVVFTGEIKEYSDSKKKLYSTENNTIIISIDFKTFDLLNVYFLSNFPDEGNLNTDCVNSYNYSSSSLTWLSDEEIIIRLHCSSNDDNFYPLFGVYKLQSNTFNFDKFFNFDLPLFHVEKGLFYNYLEHKIFSTGRGLYYIETILPYVYNMSSKEKYELQNVGFENTVINLSKKTFGFYFMTISYDETSKNIYMLSKDIINNKTHYSTFDVESNKTETKIVNLTENIFPKAIKNDVAYYLKTNGNDLFLYKESLL